MNLEQQQNQNDSPVITTSDFFLINASTLLDNNFKLAFFSLFFIFMTKYTFPQACFDNCKYIRCKGGRFAMLPMFHEDGPGASNMLYFSGMSLAYIPVTLK